MGECRSCARTIVVDVALPTRVQETGLTFVSSVSTLSLMYLPCYSAIFEERPCDVKSESHGLKGLGGGVAASMNDHKQGYAACGMQWPMKVQISARTMNRVHSKLLAHY